MKARQLAGSVPAPLIFVGSGFFQYSGAALAVTLFSVLGPGPTTWWRLLVGALTLMVLWRPWRQKWTRQDLLGSALFGITLGLMNLLFYEAIARIPLGAAVSVEFLGPVAIAVFRGRGVPPRLAALLALVGIALIGGWGLDLSAPGVLTGVLFALGAALMWAGYILLGQAIAQRRSGVNSLAVGCLTAAVVFTPFLAPAALAVEFTGPVILAILGVGIFSTAIPYSLEAIAFRRLTPAVFALLTALLPATSTLIGALALRQIPTPGDLVGLLFVSVAVWLASRVT